MSRLQAAHFSFLKYPVSFVRGAREEGVGDELAHLAASYVVVGQETGRACGTGGAIVVATYNIVEGDALDVQPVCVAVWHVGEGLLRGGDYVEVAFGVAHELGGLPPGHVVGG